MSVMADACRGLLTHVAGSSAGVAREFHADAGQFAELVCRMARGGGSARWAGMAERHPRA
jgi:hypothetical protein